MLVTLLFIFPTINVRNMKEGIGLHSKRVLATHFFCVSKVPLFCFFENHVIDGRQKVESGQGDCK